jgi:hypothetical protein
MSRLDQPGGGASAIATARVDRRTLLFAAAAGALGLPAALGGCGQTTPKAHDGTDYQILFNVGPQADLIRLVTARATATGMSPQAIAPVNGSAVATLRAMTARSAVFDPQTNAYPVSTALAVVGAVSSAALDPVAATGLARGVKIVSYPVALRHRSAAIVVDQVQASGLLAATAAAWAHSNLGGRGHVLIVLPTLDPAVDPYAPFLPQIEQTLRSTLAERAPGLEVVTTHPLGTGNTSVSLLREAQVVLTYDDAIAAAVAQQARRELSAAARQKFFVGAVALPAVASRATFDELRRDDLLRAVVAARLRDLADAMVDLPNTLLNGGSAGDVRLPLELLTPRSSALATFERDYALNPSTPNLSGASSFLNSAAQGAAHPRQAAPAPKSKVGT